MDWTAKLPERLRNSLDALLDRVENNEEAYMNAQNASVGQIWVAMALLNERMNKMERHLRAQRKAINELSPNQDVGEKLDSNLEESLKRY